MSQFQKLSHTISPYRAVEEYRKVLILDPNNGVAEKRLAILGGAGD